MRRLASEPPRKRLVAVEDSLGDRALLRRALLGRGVDVLSCMDAVEGLEAVVHYRPDAVLVDLHMGRGFNGLDLLRMLKQNRDTDRIPVVVLTGDPTAEARNQAMEAGAAAFILKSFDIDAMADEVIAACGL